MSCQAAPRPATEEQQLPAAPWKRRPPESGRIAAPVMERLARLARRIGWPGREREEARRRQLQEEEERRRRQCRCDLIQAARRFLRVLESLLLWENSCNSISVAIAFNILFWCVPRPGLSCAPHFPIASERPTLSPRDFSAARTQLCIRRR